MKEDDIIIRLIGEDFKYHRFVSVIYMNETIPKEYELNILKIVSLLMGIEDGNLTDDWIQCYMKYITRAVTRRSISPFLIAEDCYQSLKEKRTN